MASIGGSLPPILCSGTTQPRGWRPRWESPRGVLRGEFGSSPLTRGAHSSTSAEPHSDCRPSEDMRPQVCCFEQITLGVTCYRAHPTCTKGPTQPGADTRVHTGTDMLRTQSPTPHYELVVNNQKMSFQNLLKLEPKIKYMGINLTKRSKTSPGMPGRTGPCLGLENPVSGWRDFSRSVEILRKPDQNPNSLLVNSLSCTEMWEV